MTAAADPATDALLGLYRRAPMEFVRADGVRLFDADGTRLARLRGRDRGERARLQRRRRSARRCSRRSTPGSCTSRTSIRTAPGERLAEKLVGGVVRRPGVLLQLGRRGERGRVQVRAEVGEARGRA